MSSSASSICNSKMWWSNNSICLRGGKGYTRRYVDTSKSPQMNRRRCSAGAQLGENIAVVVFSTTNYVAMQCITIWMGFLWGWAIRYKSAANIHERELKKKEQRTRSSRDTKQNTSLYISESAVGPTKIISI